MLKVWSVCPNKVNNGHALVSGVLRHNTVLMKRNKQKKFILPHCVHVHMYDKKKNKTSIAPNMWFQTVDTSNEHSLMCSLAKSQQEGSERSNLLFRRPVNHISPHQNAFSAVDNECDNDCVGLYLRKLIMTGHFLFCWSDCEPPRSYVVS